MAATTTGACRHERRKVLQMREFLKWLLRLLLGEYQYWKGFALKLD